VKRRNFMDKYEFLHNSLTLEDLEKLSKKPHYIIISPQLKDKILKSRDLLEKRLNKKEKIKDILTYKKERKILSPEEIRAIMILKAYSLALGYSGVRIELIEKLLEFIENDILPIIPENFTQNPLIYIYHVLKGKGEVLYKNKRMETIDALSISNIELLNLDSHEYSTIINGTQFITGIGSLCYLKAKRLGKLEEIVSALFLESLEVKDKILNPWVHALRPHLGQIKSFENLKILLSNNKSNFTSIDTWDIKYKIYIPQIMSYFHQVMDFLREILEIEINSVSYDLIFIPEEEKIIWSGNSHKGIIVNAINHLSYAVSQIISLWEKEIEFLSSLYLSIIKSIINKNKKLIKPIDTNIEKNVINLRSILKNWEYIISIKIILACRKLDYYKEKNLSKGTKFIYEYIKSLIPLSEESVDNIKIIQNNLYDILEKVEEEVGELF
jgi:histidine ammonia-lyase